MMPTYSYLSVDDASIFGSRESIEPIASHMWPSRPLPERAVTLLLSLPRSRLLAVSPSSPCLPA